MAAVRFGYRPAIVLAVLAMVCLQATGICEDSRAIITQTQQSRGYFTTPQELAVIAEKSAKGIKPYKSAVDQILLYAKEPSFWPYGKIDGPQDAAGKTLVPAYLGHGSPLIYAKALAYHLTGNVQYAVAIRGLLLDLIDTTGYGGEVYSGSNQNILNLSWYVPGFIMAADLIEGYAGWTPVDKRSFQEWLAREIYKKVDWASDRRSNNWGSAGSAAAGFIADYLTGSDLMLVDRDGNRLTPAQAYTEAKQRQVDRMNGNTYMDNYGCGQAVGIRPDGGIPEELKRGSTGCDGLWIKELDGSYNYMMTHLQGTVAHAELLLRRGDNSIYENKTATGAGSILRAIHFLINNPNDPAKSVKYEMTATLELAYRYYRDPYIAQQLGIGTPDRRIGTRSNQMLHFGTITHGFAVDENPGPPPVTAPPI